MKRVEPARPKHAMARHARVAFGLSAIIATVMLCGYPQAATNVRVMHVTQSQHVPPAVSDGTAAFAGWPDAHQSLQLSLSLPQRNEAELNQFLQDLQDPRSASYHQYLSVEEYTARFGPTQEDYDQVVAWARTNGLTVTETTSNRRLVNVAAPVDAVNRALCVQVSNYRHPSEDRIFRCGRCGYVYTDDPDVDRSRCSQCGQPNEAIRF